MMKWLKGFFFTYVWIGVVLLLIAIVLDLFYPTTTRHYLGSIFINLLSSLGMAIVISAIFSFASGTSEFMEKIRGLLEDIVVSKKFLTNIAPKGKKEALKALIQPSSNDMNKYPNIGDYYGFFIDKTLEIEKKNVRSNYQVSTRAYFDESKNKIAIDGVYRYRLFPCANGFNDIIVGFEDKDSFCSVVSVSKPNGDKKNFKDPELIEMNENGDVSRKATIKINDFADKETHLDVELKIIEFGTDHWSLLQFKALQPTDGFNFTLRCDGNIEIRKHTIFVVDAKYNVDASECKKSFSVTCNQWINEGSGLVVLVSIPQS